MFERGANPIFDSFFADAGSELKAVKDQRGLKAVCSKANEQLDGVFTKELARSESSIACCSGCFYCCYLKVDVQPKDVFLIVDYIRSHFSPEKQSQVLERARENWKKIEPMTAKQHFSANLQCPLLEQGKCSVYPVRPATCRIHHSRRVESCKESFEHPELLDGPEDIVPSLKIATASAHVGITKAFEEYGYDSKAYDLNAALVEALTNPKSVKRWRDGKAAFPKNMVAKDMQEAEKH